MATYTTIKAYVDSYIYDNITEDITGAIHNDVLHELIDAVGAAQVYVFPETTDNPGTPQNPRAYIALPGTYTNFLTALATPAVITAPLGVLLWNGGPYWTVIQLPFPSADDYTKCKTTAALTATTSYTTVAISMMDGGIAAKAGTWVKLVNRRTGQFEFVQLTADVADDATSISFTSYQVAYSYPAGSIVEFYPTTGLITTGKVLLGDGANNYVTVPSTWRMPNSSTVDEDVWLEMIDIYINGMPCRWAAAPVSPFDFDLNSSNRLQIEFANILTVNDRVTVKYRQPKIY